MRRVVENMGLDWARQSVKLSEQASKFNCGDIATVGADGKARGMLSMPVEKLALWLASIGRTPPEKSDMLESAIYSGFLTFISISYAMKTGVRKNV